MKNHYKTLSLVNSASQDEIRRAYRILARRYHPDVNPDDKGGKSSQRFSEISEAYEVLSSEQSRAQYDAEFESFQRRKLEEKFKIFQRAQQEKFEQKTSQATRDNFGKIKPEQDDDDGSNNRPDISIDIHKIGQRIGRGLDWILERWDQAVRFVKLDILGHNEEELNKPKVKRGVSKVSIVEVSLSVEDAIKGVRRKIEISEPEGIRRVSVVIPAGVRDGSVIRLRDTNQGGEDLVLIIRLASHPFLSLKARGLIVEVPVTIEEALYGAQISIPGIEDQVMLKIPPGSQAGNEIRLKGQGIVGRNGARGDLIVRLLIHAPDAPEAVGLKEKVVELSQYYGSNVRRGLPRVLGG